MADSPEVKTAIAAAEEAAGRGDMAAAEGHLRRAVELQQAAPGLHPDFAETLNNLGIVCERLGNDADAERCYRTAYATASAAFAPDHPSVTTTATNLREFCEARGLPLELPAAAVAATAGEPAPLPDPQPLPPPRPAPDPRPLPLPAPAPPPAPSPGRPEPRQAVRSQLPPVAATRSPILPVLLVGAAAVAVVVMFVRSRPADAPAPAADAPVTRPETRTPPARADASPQADAAARSSTPPAHAAPPPPAAPAKPAPRARSAVVPTVLSAELCHPLQTGATWHCDPVAGTVSDGVVYFYTRLAASADTTIEHRWYHAGRLHQSVTLHISANAAGFRTYSRLTVSPARAGDWRVDVRAADGTVLSEKRFTVGR